MTFENWLRVYLSSFSVSLIQSASSLIVSHSETKAKTCNFRPICFKEVWNSDIIVPCHINVKLAKGLRWFLAKETTLSLAVPYRAISEFECHKSENKSLCNIIAQPEIYLLYCSFLSQPDLDSRLAYPRPRPRPRLAYPRSRLSSPRPRPRLKTY